MWTIRVFSRIAEIGKRKGVVETCRNRKVRHEWCYGVGSRKGPMMETTLYCSSCNDVFSAETPDARRERPHCPDVARAADGSYQCPDCANNESGA